MPRCKFQSQMSEAVKAFLQKNHRTDAPWGWSLFANGRLERRWRTSKLCWNVNSSNFAFDSSSFELCVHLHGIIVLGIFLINPNSRPLPTFLPFPHGTRRRTLAWGPTPPVPSRDARRRPCTAELLQGGTHNSARITQRRFSPWTTWLPSCGSRGSWLRRGWGLWMERGDLPGVNLGSRSAACIFPQSKTMNSQRKTKKKCDSEESLELVRQKRTARLWRHTGKHNSIVMSIPIWRGSTNALDLCLYRIS